MWMHQTISSELFDVTAMISTELWAPLWCVCNNIYKVMSSSVMWLQWYPQSFKLLYDWPTIISTELWPPLWYECNKQYLQSSELICDVTAIKSTELWCDFSTIYRALSLSVIWLKWYFIVVTAIKNICRALSCDVTAIISTELWAHLWSGYNDILRVVTSTVMWLQWMISTEIWASLWYDCNNIYRVVSFSVMWLQ